MKKHKLKDFINKTIFYKVPEEEKAYIRQATMEADHKSIRWILLIIFLLQLIMVAYKCISTQLKFDNRDFGYLACYLSLSLSCVIISPLLEALYRRKMANAYVITVAILIHIFYLWAAAITILDSLKGYEELTTFAYVALALTAFVVLEPWVFISDVLIYIIGLDLIFALVPELHLYSSILISSISIAILSCLICVFTFIRRTESLRFQKKYTELNNSLNDRAYHDDLTTIYNRRYLTEHIDDTVYLGSNGTGSIMFDIDNFKNINDTYGHQNGDICLKKLGLIIKDFIQDKEDCYAVRYGGEEFLITFLHIKKDNLIELAEILRKAVEDCDIKLTDGQTIHLTISIGVSYGKVGNNYTSLINKADENLYVAKSTGKNRVYFE